MCIRDSGNIGVNFYMELSNKIIADKDAYMQFTLPNGTVTKVLVSEAQTNTTINAEKTYYRFPCEVASYEMTQDIKAQMRDQAIPNGVIINDAYCDRSMTRDYDREALNAFFATLKEEDFEVVVVRSLNEITDDIYDLEEFVKTITDMGIWLYSLEVGPVPITVSHAEDFGC